MAAFAQAQFLTSVAELEQLPPAGPPEVAFAGRSNVGKSSAINALTRRKRLAFFSRTPGRTQMLNFFDLGGRAHLVDLPGYGYARVPRPLQAQWDRLIGGYLSERPSLVAVVVIMDARRPFMPNDSRVMEWLRPLGRKVLVLLSKSDKISRSERATALAKARRSLFDLAVPGEVRLFSSLNGEGVDEVRALLESWLAAADANKKPPVRGSKPGAKTP